MFIYDFQLVSEVGGCMMQQHGAIYGQLASQKTLLDQFALA